MIVITGATGQLGRLVVDDLLGRGAPGTELAVAVRTPARVADLMDRGVDVRIADYSRPETLAPAFKGADRLLLISGSEVGQRLAQHTNAINAAVDAAVGLIAYTSILKADSTSLSLAEEHLATEAAIRKSGLPHVFLRNGWYTENYTGNLAPALRHGAILGCAGDGRISAATRADFAAAAATVILGDGHENRSYELGGDEAFTMAELAAEITAQSGREVVYRDLPAEEYVKTLLSVGMPEPVAGMLANADLGVRRGDLYTDSHDLSRLAGRPTTPLAEAVRLALAG